MTPWIRKLHKWFGLLIALQFVVWMASGLIMSVLDRERVEGLQHQARSVPESQAWPDGMLAPARILAMATQSIQTIEATWLQQRPVYRLTNKPTVWLVDARDGSAVRVDAATASVIAASDYRGEGRPGPPEWMRSANLEARGHPGPIWRVPFDDADATTLYISGIDGRILERRNSSWRLFDIAWMLHIMDYTGRRNFNNPLVIMAAAGGLWMALSGVWLLIASFRLIDLVRARR